MSTDGPQQEKLQRGNIFSVTNASIQIQVLASVWDPCYFMRYFRRKMLPCGEHDVTMMSYMLLK